MPTTIILNHDLPLLKLLTLKFLLIYDLLLLIIAYYNSQPLDAYPWPTMTIYSYPLEVRCLLMTYNYYNTLPLNLYPQPNIIIILNP